MVRRILVIVTVTAISTFCISGCKKSSDESQPAPEEPKTLTEYKADAEKEINKENMAAELDKLEKEVEQDIGVEK